MDQQSNLNEKCYELLKLIPEGKVTTYKELARALGSKAWRSVGSAMAKNNNLVITPCHRVVRSDGTIGEYARGSMKKAELLMNEGVEIFKGKVKNLAIYFFKFRT